MVKGDIRDDGRVESADPDDDLTTEELVKRETELLQKRRKSAGSTGYTTQKKLLILQSRMGNVNTAANMGGRQLNNILPSQYNDVVERYATRFPISRGIHSRNYAMPSSSGRTAYEVSRRRNRGNKKVKRKRRKRK
jgi:hypothetical protein